MASFVKVVISLNFFIMAALGLYNLYNVSKKKKPKVHLRSFCDCEENTYAAVNATTPANQVNIDYVHITRHAKRRYKYVLTKSHGLLCLSDDSELPPVWRPRKQHITIRPERQNYFIGFYLFFNFYWILHQDATGWSVLTRIICRDIYVCGIHDNVKVLRCEHKLV